MLTQEQIEDETPFWQAIKALSDEEREKLAKMASESIKDAAQMILEEIKVERGANDHRAHASHRPHCLGRTSSPLGGPLMITGWLLIAFVFFVIFSALFVPFVGIDGLFYAWLSANVAVVVFGFVLVLGTNS